MNNIRIALHGGSCICGGTGWIAYPGIGRRAVLCPSKNETILSVEEWEALGKPKTIEEYHEKGGPR